MKRSRFSEEQIIAILREQEGGIATAEICRRHGVSSATFYAWKAKYGGLEVSQARRLKVLEDENARLKKLLAEAMLDVAVLRDVTAKSGDARGAAIGSGTCACCLRPLRAAGLPRFGLRPVVGALRQFAAGRCRASSAAAAIGLDAPAVRLAPAASSPGSGGDCPEPQEASADPCRGTTAGPSPRGPKAGSGHAGADGPAAGAEPALVARLRLGCTQRWAALSHPGCRRRCQPRVSGPRRRFVPVRCPCRSGT